MADQLRLFVGVALDERWTDLLSATADRLRTSLGNRVRWVRPDLYHVTVVFLGNQSGESVPEIGEALEQASASIAPFELRLVDVRRLGRHEHGAIVAGVQDLSSSLRTLRGNLDEQLRRRGVRFDTKALAPHVTLGRPRRGAGSIDVPHVDLGESPSLNVTEVALFKSDLRPDGPRYEIMTSTRVGVRPSPW
jgi:2'-5' RNA ligase